MATSSAQVPKQLHGYSLQFTECVKSLIDAKPGAVVSVEVFEDVGTVSPNGDTVATQVKAGTGANPISDGSPELWKTIRNWIDQCNSLVINPTKTHFNIYVNAKAKGKLCSTMSAADDDASVADCLTKIREHFTNKRGGKFKPSLGDEIKKHLTVILDPSNRAVLSLIIRNFSYRPGSGSAYIDLLARFKLFPFNEGVIELGMVYIVGWTKKRIDELIESDLPSKIDRDDFWLALTTYCQKAQQQPYLVRYTYTPSHEEIESHSSRAYVRQLGFIESTTEQQIEAVTDYLSAKAAIVEYIDRGVINESSVDEYAKDLQKLWKLYKQGLEIGNSAPDPVLFGKRLLNRCLLANVLLQGSPTPSSLTPGCFHELADKRNVGWHPDYLTLLELI